MIANTSKEVHVAIKTGIKFSQLNISLVLLGLFLSVLAYQSHFPAFAALLFYLFGRMLLTVPLISGDWERRIFDRVFMVGWVMVGVAGIYAEMFEDQFQLYSDPAGFFEVATSSSTGLMLEEIKLLSEGALAVIIWREIYDFLYYLGFLKERYIGALVNVTAIALTGVIGIHMARLIFGHDLIRFKRLILLISSCGLLWLFAGIHMRDGVVMLFVTLQCWVWIWFLCRPDFGFRFLLLVVISIGIAIPLTLLRTEFFFVPLAMTLAGVFAIALANDNHRNRLKVLTIFFVSVLLIVITMSIYFNDIVDVFVNGYESYNEGSADSHGENSLGMQLVVNQAIPVRAAVGIVYLYIFPIPFWGGLQFDSAYHLFKSFNVLFFYFVVPLLMLGIWQLYRFRCQRTSVQLFILFVSFGFSMVIALTSLETRHLGAFLIPILLLALLPDLTIYRVWKQYKLITSVFLTFIFSLHIMWVFLKVMV